MPVPAGSAPVPTTTRPNTGTAKRPVSGSGDTSKPADVT